MRFNFKKWKAQVLQTRELVLAVVRDAHKGSAASYTIHTLNLTGKGRTDGTPQTIEVHLADGSTSAFVQCFNHGKQSGRGVLNLAEWRWVDFELV